MTRDVTPDIQSIRLFLTEPHECSYLDDRSASTAFVDPELAVDIHLYSRLSELGFRRSGRYIYAPRCEGCQACIATRIPAVDFKPTRQQRRCARRNQDLTIRVERIIDHDEHYPLYQDYIAHRHSDGDMYPPTRCQYDDFIGNLLDNSRIMEFRLEGKLICAAIIDLLDDGLSAIYTYYSPAEDKRSLGTFGILSQIELARELGLQHVYLGYWIKQCAKMAYKANFRPLEILIKNQWRRAN